MKVKCIDFEVYKYDWLACWEDPDGSKGEVVNDPDELRGLYREVDLWIGYNIKNYDQYIMSAVLAGFDAREMNDWIIKEGKDGWQFSDVLRQYPVLFYDTMPSPPVGLKTLEGMMGHDIRETMIPFNIDRKLTPAEIREVLKYCHHDVQETIEVFNRTGVVYDAHVAIIDTFGLPAVDIKKTSAQLTAAALQCRRRSDVAKDEHRWEFLPCVEIERYADILDFFTGLRRRGIQGEDVYTKKGHPENAYSRPVAGVMHQFGVGGCHSLNDTPIHAAGDLYHIDVSSYYPTLLIRWGLITRATKHPEIYEGVYNTRLRLKREGKKREQAPYKKILNGLSGAMKDHRNPAYDPMRNNMMCINGQLGLVDLIEHLENGVSGFCLIQSNTDGLIIQIAEGDAPKAAMNAVCDEWEHRWRCSLEREEIEEIWQRDVNNYIYIGSGGGIVRKGAAVKPCDGLTDMDLPLVRTAIVERILHDTPITDTINECQDLYQFQRVVKLSSAYEGVRHYHGGQTEALTPKMHKPTGRYEYTRYTQYGWKTYRVFATKDSSFGPIKKYRAAGEAAFADTPEHAMIYNDDVTQTSVPNWLDRAWYINLATDRYMKFIGAKPLEGKDDYDE